MANVPLIILTGESNSGGYGTNTALLAEELAASSLVKTVNNDSSYAIEDLDIGTNNITGHSSLEGASSTQHGFEAQLLRSMLYDGWGNAPFVMLAKRGSGGSTVSQWSTGGTAMNNLEATIAAAISHIEGLGHTPQVTIWISIGLNDIQQSTNITTFKSAMVTWIARIRTVAEDADAPVILTKFSPSAERNAMNTALEEVATTVGNATAIDTMDVGLATGSYHWNTAQLKVVGQDMIDLSAGFSGYTLATRLSSFWKLDEASGNALDAHGSNPLTETSGTIATGTGLVYATARDFEAGDTEHFSGTDPGGGRDNWTAMVWFKTESLAGTMGLLWNGGDGGTTAFRWGTSVNSSGVVSFVMGVAGTTTLGPTISTTVTNGTWNQLVFGFDSDNDTMFAFVNNNKYTLFSNGTKNAGTGQPFIIGAGVGGAGVTIHFDGLMGPACFARRVWSDAEVAELYNAGAGLSYEDMVSGAVPVFMHHYRQQGIC